jgi:hypothetical protein
MSNKNNKKKVNNNKLPFELGDYIENKKTGIVYRVNGYGRNRTTGIHYYVLDDNTIVLENSFNKYFKKTY